MKDIVGRMRSCATWLRGSWKSTHHATADLLDSGADEIERLKAEIAEIEKDREAWREADALAGYGWHNID